MTTTPQSLVAKRGDVLLVLFPNSDLHTAKTRPAVVVQADNLATVTEVAIDRVIGSLPTADIDAALAHTLGLRTTPVPMQQPAPVPD